jgi:hypothetical protein
VQGRALFGRDGNMIRYGCGGRPPGHHRGCTTLPHVIPTLISTGI